MKEADEDARLIRESLEGHHEAFAQLVRKYQDKIYNVVFRLVRNTEDARDIVQDVFVQCYQALGRFQGQSAFYTWLYRIAVNAAISLKRRQRSTDSLEQGRAVAGIEPVDENLEADPTSGLELEDVRRQVLSALQSLPQEYRTILILKEMEGLKYDAIAQIMDCPIGTVRSRLHRARMELRGRLKELIEEH